ncbi:hypothetical protein MKW94_022093 [Papaver nudicaule]|uniref:PIPK domain-containing protein n=1 Tax=Papaver nudicaule TaxID=74823 RepID=A0AA41V4M2_PAPNU|nr:hypothetical protein [Papaver nudicaule]
MEPITDELNLAAYGKRYAICGCSRFLFNVQSTYYGLKSIYALVPSFPLISGVMLTKIKMVLINQIWKQETFHRTMTTMVQLTMMTTRMNQILLLRIMDSSGSLPAQKMKKMIMKLSNLKMMRKMSHFQLKVKQVSRNPLRMIVISALQVDTCRSCEMPSEAHIHSYIHRQGALSVSVKKLVILLPGEGQGKIWMWHRCLMCPRVNGSPPSTRRVVMSDAAWGLSFGKFLELSVSDHSAANIVASCGHSLHRDCLRFYGFGRMVACFRYAPINVYSVYLPPSKVDHNYNRQEWLQNEANEVVEMAGHLFAEVSNALCNIADQKTGSRGLVTELERLLIKEKAELEESLQKSLNREAMKGQPIIDILAINRLRRQLIFNIYLWDQRLVYAASSDNESCNEKISSRFLSACQFSKAENLFETLDSAWTGKNRPRNIAGKESNILSCNAVLDNSSMGDAAMKRAELEDQPEEDRGTLETTQLEQDENVELCPTWVRVPFLELYNSINTNSLKMAPDLDNSAQHLSLMSIPNLDRLGQYDPVYLSVLRELPRLGGGRFFLPVGVDGIVVPVYDDEPTSVISYALASPDYHSQLSGETERLEDGAGSMHPDEAASESFRSGGVGSLHTTVSFSDDGLLGKVKYNVTCYYSKSFEALRRISCPTEPDFIRSLSRCKKREPQGAKSNVFFAKSLDDRFIVKQITKTELGSFLKFAPEYFKHLSESIDCEKPTCLAKILGIYQVSSKHLNGGKDVRMDILVMENLMFGRKLARIYNLKGSTRSRYNADPSGSNKVLLDQNLIEEMPTSPIFMGNKAKRLLERAVWNDTSFLASIDVMNYSLLVGVDEEKLELVVGIIGYFRQYTWDKHLETWLKVFFGGSKNSTPTVISPKEYKKRFRKAMSVYFPMVPDQ